MSDSSTPAALPPERRSASSIGLTVAYPLVRFAAVALTIALPLVVFAEIPDYSRPKVLVLYLLVGIMILGWAGAYTIARRPRWMISAPEIALWAFLLAAFVSSWTSVHLRATLLGAPARHEGLLAFLAYATLYFVGVHFLGTEEWFSRLARAAAGAAIAVAAYGIAQGFAGSFRPPSTIGSPVFFGGYLCVVIPLLLALTLSPRGWVLAMWSVGATGALAVMFMTQTRAAWVALAIGLILFAYAVGSAALFRARRTLVAVVLVAIALDVAWAARLVQPQEIGGRAVSTFIVESGSLGQRLYMWRQTLRLITARPVLGWGLETLRDIFPYDRPAMVPVFGQAPVIIDKAHNDILQVAVSVGIPGAAAYAAFWVLVVAAAVRLWRREAGDNRLLAAGGLAAIVAYLLQVQFSFSVVGLAPLVWLLAGAAAGWERGVSGGVLGQDNEVDSRFDPRET